MRDFCNGDFDMDMDVDGGMDVQMDCSGDYDVEAEISPDSGGTDHRLLSHRDEKEQHPIKAISGLRQELDDIEDDIGALKQVSDSVKGLVENAEQTFAEIREIQENSVQSVLLAESISLEHMRVAREESVENVRQEGNIAAQNVESAKENALKNISESVSAAQNAASSAENSAGAAITAKNEAQTAAQNAKDLEAEIQSKLDSGEFKGEKGDPFEYEDFTEEQLAEFKGPKGDPGPSSADGISYDNSGSKLDAETVQAAIDVLTTSTNEKVDKIDGKGLSTNDYTTTEKEKLAGIADGANKYTHPAYTARTGVPTANAALSHGGTFTVTQPVCDATGHITAMNTRTYTLPADNNTDTKVTCAPTTTAVAYITGTTSASTTTGSLVFRTGTYIDSSGRLVVDEITANSGRVRNDGIFFANTVSGNTGSLLCLEPPTGTGVCVQNGSGSYTSYFLPMTSSDVPCGTSSYPWYRVYGSLGYSTTSDAREKSDIVPIADLPSMYSRGVSDGNVMERLFDKLIPSVYHVNTDVDNKLHIGFIAQDIVAAMEDTGMTEDDLGLVIHEYWIDEDTEEEKDRYSLVYEELTSLNTYIIQKMQNQIDLLEERITAIENR